ncbi:MAG TPA: cation diffusion facilitator family transporter [Polyangiaceae bacterium]
MEHAHHDHGHPHGHHHGHHHAHPAPGNLGRAFIVGIALNLGFVLVEVVYGALAHSLALIADAGHNVGDVLGLGLAWGATALAKRKPSKRRTFGFRRSTIVASVANALILLFVTGGLTWESILRLLAPQRPDGGTMIVVALAGAGINSASALLFMKGREQDLNRRSAFVHLASDAVLAVGVAVAGAVILRTGWLWLDPAVSIVLALAILAGTWSLMSQSLNLMLDAVPEGIDPGRVKAFLGELPGVVEVHDLHIWEVTSGFIALSAHVVVGAGEDCHELRRAIQTLVQDEFGVEHTTLQVDHGHADQPPLKIELAK